ncbi:MAG: hypothetical protein KH260_08700 [Lachnospiraceae bacterium oral taxon 082]|nr:hypothetical protein [Lachnospiraceae bacterium oral taxon 082]
MCDYIRYIMWIELWKAPIWNVLVAIGTVSSVIVSLYLANRKSKVVRKLNIVKQFKESYSKGEIYMLITIENIGNVPIILDEYGREFAKKNYIMTDIQEFIVNKDEFIMIKPNEAKLVTYKYNFGCPFEENYSKICNSCEYQLFTKTKFKAKDTLGNYYLQI